MTIKLTSTWAPFFKSKPETGMGYWICTAVLKDGRRFDRVVVTGGIITSIDGNADVPFTETDVAEFIVTHDKSCMLNDSQNKNQWMQLVRVLDSLIKGDTNLTEGCRAVVQFRYILKQEKNDLFLPFVGYDSESDAFPLGEIRNLWSQEGLKKMDREKDATEGHYKTWVLDAAGKLRQFAQDFPANHHSNASKYDQKIAATGVWQYDKTNPRKIEITASSAKYAASRFNDDDQLDETRPIPVTPDGMVYRVGATSGVDFHTLDDAKRWADAQPWGPVKWD